MYATLGEIGNAFYTMYRYRYYISCIFCRLMIYIDGRHSFCNEIERLILSLLLSFCGLGQSVCLSVYLSGEANCSVR